MELTEALRRRRMCRDFDPAASVSREWVIGALRLAARAPSAGFSQGTSFVVIDTSEMRDAFWSTATPLSGRSGGGARPDAWLRGVSRAPVLIAVLADPSRYEQRYALADKTHEDSDPASWPTPFWDVDAGMAVMSLLLLAENAGLGALFFGVPARAHAPVRRLLGVGDSERLIGMVAVGSPGERAPGEPAVVSTPGARAGRPERRSFGRRVRFAGSPPEGPEPTPRR